MPSEPTSNPFFDHPILNSPYARPARHWELDDQGQPTQKIEETRRRAAFITPIPKPKKKKRSPAQQQELVLDEGKGLSTTIETYWVPGVNQLGTYGRWAFAEFRDIYEIEANFKAKVQSAFDEMIAASTSSKQEVHA